MKRRILSVAITLTLAGLVLAQERFDDVVRSDFFAGFAGNKQALDRGMKVTEEALLKNPKHAEAKVWHGSGIFFRATEAFQKGDFQKGVSLWQQGLEEMQQAVQLAPANVTVLIPRGATLISASRYAPPEFAKPILETGVSDFEKVLKLQEQYFAKLPIHSRGELLTGLADGSSRLGRQDKAREYFSRITVELKGSVYEEKARAWLENKPQVKSPEFFSCSGCHVR
jgi:tetratricopeptide (TPR) repeat protein